MGRRYTRKLIRRGRRVRGYSGFTFLLVAIAFGGRLKAHDFGDLSESALITRSFSAASTSPGTKAAR